MTTTLSLTENSSLVIQRHAKSFAWAARIFSAKTYQQVSDLYQFCRFADDIVDTQSVEKARLDLENLRLQLRLKQSELPLLKRVLASGVPAEALNQLLLGVEMDLIEVKNWSEKQLLIYAYRVAGVVGLMMCPIIGVRDRSAFSFAIDLGIAMQLTNIARDFKEDSKLGRVYLPQAWLTEVNLSHEQFLAGEARTEQIQALAKRILKLADVYYASGRKGLSAIPFRPRMAIAVAARIYQAIGTEIARQNYNPWLGRAFVSPSRKLWLTMLEILAQIFKPKRSYMHDSSLHAALTGLPGVAS